VAKDTQNQPTDKHADPAATHALKAEAEDTDLTVEFEEHTYTIVYRGPDVELYEDLQTFNDGDPLVIPRIVKRFLGAEQYDDFKDRYRDENGNVPLKPLVALFWVINGALGE
jgi:DNA topoisomerase IB